MERIGQHYHDTCDNHVSTVPYYGGDIRVLENEWDDGEYMVAQDRGVDDTMELRSGRNG